MGPKKWTISTTAKSRWTHQNGILQSTIDDLTEKLQRLKEKEHQLIIDNQKLEEELNGLNNESASNDKLPHSFSSRDKKMDLFNSEPEVNSNDSIDEESDLGKKEYCAQCLKMFDLNVRYDSSSLEKTLDKEVQDFELDINAKMTEKNKIFDQLYAELVGTIKDTLKINFELYPYGSFASRLNLPWSDIDIVLDTFSEAGLESLELLETAFARQPLITEVKFIKNTSIPVLKLVANAQYDNLKIDITLQDPRHSGVQCVGLIHQYMNMYPFLRPIALVLKQLLYLGKLNDPYQKGLSSYGLVLMIVAYFQWLVYSNTYEEVCANRGRALIQLLKHYGSSLDYINWKIAPSLTGEIINPYIPVA